MILFKFTLFWAGSSHESHTSWRESIENSAAPCADFAFANDPCVYFLQSPLSRDFNTLINLSCYFIISRVIEILNLSMALVIGRMIRPVNGLTKQAFTTTHLGLKRLHPVRLMAANPSQYHYHEKPPAHAHDKLWKAERYLSFALLGVLPASAIFPHPIMDYAVATSLVVHVHWGVEAIVTDYVRPSIFGKTIPKVSIVLVYLLSSLTLGGLFMFNYTDVGITQATRMLAKAM